MVAAFVSLVGPFLSCRAQDRVTILYDAFGESSNLTKDWGFSALVEHDGKRILFDTGNNAEIFEKNVKAMEVNFGKLDFVVISHRHADHATGLRYVLELNPRVTVYVPADGANGFGGAPLPQSFLRADGSLPANMRYFDGKYPPQIISGNLYDTGNFVLVGKTIEIAAGIFLVRTVSENKGTLEMPELTLAIKRANGLLLVDGCSHAGIEAVLAGASSIDPRTEIVFGGLHLVTTSLDEIDTLVGSLPDKMESAKDRAGSLHRRARIRATEEGVWGEIHVRGTGKPHRSELETSLRMALPGFSRGGRRSGGTAEAIFSVGRNDGRGHTCGLGAKAQLLQSQGIELPRGIQPVGGLKLPDCRRR